MCPCNGFQPLMAELTSQSRGTRRGMDGSGSAGNGYRGAAARCWIRAG